VPVAGKKFVGHQSFGYVGRYSMNINGKSPVYGIIGWPVAHSLSPVFQNHFLRLQGVNGVYVPFPVTENDLAVALEGLAAAGIHGLNVTVPHKEALFALVKPDEEACVIGAVNTLKRSHDGQWHASNTDWHGFRSVIEGLGLSLAGRRVMLFGAGGTARAAIHALANCEAHITLCNRSDQRREALLAHIARAYPTMRCEGIPWRSDVVECLCSEAELLINTTTIGLGDEPREFPFRLTGHGAAIDAVYCRDGATTFCRAARQEGRLAVDGLPMLVAQGAASFAWWHDAPSPSLADTLAYMQQYLGRVCEPLTGWQ